MEVEELPAAAEAIGEVTEVMTEVLKEEESGAENTYEIEEEEKQRGGEGGEEEEQGGAKKRKVLWESEVRTCWDVGDGQQPQLLSLSML